MLRAHSDHVCAYFAVDYDLQLGLKIAEAAERIYAEAKPPQAAAQIPSVYNFQWPDERYFLTLDVRRIGWQSLRLREWLDNHDRHAAVIRKGLDIIGIRELKRIGFKLTAYLPMQMSHAELCELMFGTFLPPRADFDEVLPQPIDPLVQLEGERGEFKYILTISPMNETQIVRAFREHKNLANFLKDKLLDPGIKEFQDHITSTDCLFFDIDLYQTNVPVDALNTFVKGSFAECDAVADACVRRLRSQPISGGKDRG